MYGSKINGNLWSEASNKGLFIKYIKVSTKPYLDIFSVYVLAWKLEQLMMLVVKNVCFSEDSSLFSKQLFVLVGRQVITKQINYSVPYSTHTLILQTYL